MIWQRQLILMNSFHFGHSSIIIPFLMSSFLLLRLLLRSITLFLADSKWLIDGLWSPINHQIFNTYFVSTLTYIIFDNKTTVITFVHYYASDAMRISTLLVFLKQKCFRTNKSKYFPPLIFHHLLLFFVIIMSSCR